MPDHCTHMPDLMGKQREIINRHIDEHKWCQHIEDRNDAIEDFLKTYGWIMREYYCLYVCPEREECAIAKELLAQAKKQD